MMLQWQTIMGQLVPADGGIKSRTNLIVNVSY
jgi:hypothetical protein